MSSGFPPQPNFDLATLTQESDQLHERLVDLFGQHLMWMRSVALRSVYNLVNSKELREQLGQVFREPYDEAAKMNAGDKKRAIDLAEAAVDGFIETLLRVLAHRGVDFSFGQKQCLRYRIDIEVVDLESELVVLDEAINRCGERHFADYWGRWLNRYGKWRDSESGATTS